MYDAGRAMSIVEELWVCVGRGYMGISILFAQFFSESKIDLKTKIDLR